MENNRFQNCDLIRTIAIYFVVIIHSLGCVETGLSGVNEANITNAILSIVKCAVPLFVILSGSLLLHKEESITIFYKKRLIRLIPPFIVWSFVIYFLNFIKKGEVFSIVSFFSNYITQTITSGVVSVYWYFYMILGLYLITPFLRKFLQSLNRIESLFLICLLFFIYAISLLFPDFEIATRFVSNNYIYFIYYCFGFVYIKYLKDIKLLLWVIILVFSYILNIINVLYDYTSFPFVSLYSISIFALLYRVKIANKYNVECFLGFCSKVSYGIYLFHILIISAIISSGIYKDCPLFLMPIIVGTTAFIVCLLLCVIIKKFKWLI